MSAIGGSPETLSVNGREFRYTADCDLSRKLGGFENEYAANGDSSARMLKTRVPWTCGGNIVEIDNDNGDQEYLDEVKNSPADVDITVTFVDGSTYGGKGNITGELSYSNQSATATFDLMGPGKMVKQ